MVDIGPLHIYAIGEVGKPGSLQIVRSAIGLIDFSSPIDSYMVIGNTIKMTVEHILVKLDQWDLISERMNTPCEVMDAHFLELGIYKFVQQYTNFLLGSVMALIVL